MTKKWSAKEYASPPYSQSGTWIYDEDGKHIATVHTDGEATKEDVELIVSAAELRETHTVLLRHLQALRQHQPTDPPNHQGDVMRRMYRDRARQLRLTERDIERFVVLNVWANDWHECPRCFESIGLHEPERIMHLSSCTQST